jgi:hypothetical protein
MTKENIEKVKNILVNHIEQISKDGSKSFEIPATVHALVELESINKCIN